MMNVESQKNKLGFLDGVRGAAMLIVVLHHFGLVFFPAINYLDPEKIHLGNGKVELMIAKSPLNLFFNGGFAVSIFFVLSGFVLSYKFHRTGSRKLLTEYATKRYFRLFLPVAGSIIICYLLHVFGLFTHQNVGNITKSTEWLGGIYSNMKGTGDLLRNIFLDVFFNNDNRYNPVLWTMTIEFLGSLLLFSFLALTGDTKKTLSLHIIVAALILITDKKFYAAFILGSLISKLFVDGFSFPKGLKGASIKVFILIAGIYFSTFPQGMFTQQTIWKPLEWSWTSGYDLFHVLGAFCILFVICFDNTLARFFSMKPFLYLGKVSFSFYLLHMLIMCSLGCFVFMKVWKPETYFIPFLISFIVSLAATFITSHFYHKWVDKASIKFSEKMGKLITGRDQPE